MIKKGGETIANIKKEETKKLKVRILLLISSIIVIPILAAVFVLIINQALPKQNQTDGSIFFILESKKNIIVLFSTIGYLLMAMTIFHHKPVHLKDKDVLANSKFASIKDQKEKLAVATFDLDEPIKNSGCPVNKISDTELLYDPAPVHTLMVATTAAGKSRKHVRQLVMLAIKAKESMVFNDCKKEFYYDFKKLLENKGYNILLIEFRNFEFSDHWNPMTIINEAMMENRIDDADEYANDLVNALVKESSGEPIWENGEKSLIKALILLVAQSKELSEEEKNLFTVSQMISALGNAESHLYEKEEFTFLSKSFKEVPRSKKSLLTQYIEQLPDDNIAKISYGPCRSAGENTLASFFASAQTTLAIFSSQNVARVLSRSDFDIADICIGEKPTALFIVNPDEKTTYNQVAGILYSQIYSIACKEANKLVGSCLPRRLNMILDEFGNMPKLAKFDSMISVARSRGIIFYIYVQDFSQMDYLYTADVGKVIRANCNIWVFLASSDTATCKSIEEKIGYEDKVVTSASNNVTSSFNNDSGSLSAQHQKVPLINYNDLMAYDNRDGKRTIVLKTYMDPIIANLPDATAYPWYKELIPVTLEDEKLRIRNRSIEKVPFAIPRYFIVETALGVYAFWYWSREDKNRELEEKIIDKANELLSEQVEESVDEKVLNDEMRKYVKGLIYPLQISNVQQNSETKKGRKVKNIDLIKKEKE